MTDSDLKDLIIDQCRDIIQSRYTQIKRELNLLQESANADSKSTAGDKHETGRAQIMLEKEKLARQIDDIHKHQKIFSSFRGESGKIVESGSMVYTDKGNYLISSSLGEIKNEHISLFAISPMAPIAQELLGKKSGDSIRFQGRTIQIEKIV